MMPVIVKSAKKLKRVGLGTNMINPMVATWMQDHKSTHQPVPDCSELKESELRMHTLTSSILYTLL